MSIRNQILLPIILVVLLLVGVAAGVSINQFSGYVNETGLQATDGALKGLAGEIERRKQDALTTGALLASYPGFAAAVSANDTAAVLNLMTPLVKDAKFDFMTVTNASGIVVARVHEPQKSGDSVTNQANVVSALKGTAAAFVEPGTVVKLSARAGIPIKNAAGAVVGVASVGYNLDQMDLVDRVKKLFGADFTVFLGDVRISTTIEQNGKRAVGTQLDSAIAKILLSDGKAYHGKATILGQSYLTAYMPLVGPAGKPIGVLFAGQSFKAAEDAMARTQMLIGGISLILLVISLIVMFYVVRRITRPLGIAVDDLAQLGARMRLANWPPLSMR
jgi:methyl-accepting chemotaxis protein